MPMLKRQRRPLRFGGMMSNRDYQGRDIQTGDVVMICSGRDYLRGVVTDTALFETVQVRPEGATLSYPFPGRELVILFREGEPLREPHSNV